ncbi:hypothetical protein Ais01nite_02290 [Asanoa ishikariensis]|nr:hypothetical protein Ais01nite_02290 [Asanoa ishikariensis]
MVPTELEPEWTKRGTIQTAFPQLRANLWPSRRSGSGGRSAITAQVRTLGGSPRTWGRLDMPTDVAVNSGTWQLT